MGVGFESSFLRQGFGGKDAEGDLKPQMFELEFFLKSIPSVDSAPF
jgi:hypothetical protein